MKNHLNPDFIRKILSALISFCLCFSLFGCGGSTDNPDAEMPQEDKGIYEGLLFEEPVDLNSGECWGEVGINHVGFESEKSVFDIDDVTLTIYYGDIFSSDLQYEKENGWTYEYYELYFENDKKDKVLIRHVDEDFVSEKHRCTYVKEGSLFNGYAYNCSEEFTVPKELFTEDKGDIFFCVSGWGTPMHKGEPQEDPSERIITYGGLCYKKEGNKILLSGSPFNEEESNDLLEDGWGVVN